MTHELVLSANPDLTADMITPEAFEEFYEQQVEELWRYVYQIIHDPELAHDIVHSAFVRFWEHPPRGNREYHPRAYLYRIATNLIYDEFRKRKRWLSFTRRFKTSIKKSEASSSTEQAIRSVLQKLSLRDRMLIWLAYFEGYTYDEISAILKINKKSLPVLLHRARRRFKRHLEKMGWSSATLMNTREGNHEA